MPPCRLARVLRLLDLPNHELESLADVFVVSCAGLSPGALELGADFLAAIRRDYSLLGPKVGFVAYDDHGSPVGALEQISKVSVCS